MGGLIFLRGILILSLIVSLSSGHDDGPHHHPEELQQQQPARTCSANIYPTKPGMCPQAHTQEACIWCNDQCITDNQCQGEQKCCNKPGCGNYCSPPIGNPDPVPGTCSANVYPTKPGTCPQVQTMIACVSCKDQCISDNQCEGANKCCDHSTCGNRCVPPNGSPGPGSCSAYIQPTKPGSCPRIHSHIACVNCNDNCVSDNQCEGSQKCCSHPSCGNRCVPAEWNGNPEPTDRGTCSAHIYPSKPGTCPPPDPRVLCIACNDQCITDGQCEGSMKCCNQPGCGNHCVFPNWSQGPGTCMADIVSTKEGMCPYLNPNAQARCSRCADQCDSDNDCKPIQKCCRGHCGNECKYFNYN